jgi:chromosome segregation ATPase
MREHLESAQSHSVTLEGHLESYKKHCSHLETYKEHCSHLETAREAAECDRAKAQDALALALAQLEAQTRHSENERNKAQEALALAEKQIEMHAQRNQTLEERESMLEAEKLCANEEIAELGDRLSAHRKQIDQIQQSLGWLLLNRARVVRGRLIRDDSGLGRFWRGTTRMFKSEGARVPDPRLPGKAANPGRSAG